MSDLVTCCFCMFFFTVDSCRILHVSVRENHCFFNHYKICGYGIFRNALLHCCLIISCFISSSELLSAVLSRRSHQFWQIVQASFTQWKYQVSLGWLCACPTIPDMMYCIPHSPGSCQMLLVVSHHLKQKAISVRNNVSNETNNKKAGQSRKVPLLHTLKNRQQGFC